MNQVFVLCYSDGGDNEVFAGVVTDEDVCKAWVLDGGHAYKVDVDSPLKKREYEMPYQDAMVANPREWNGKEWVKLDFLKWKSNEPST